MASLKVSSVVGQAPTTKNRNRLSIFTSSKKKNSTVSPLVALEGKKKQTSIRKTKNATAGSYKKKKDADAPHCYDEGAVLSCPYYRKQEVIPSPPPLQPPTKQPGLAAKKKKNAKKVNTSSASCDPPGYVLKRSETLQCMAISKQLNEQRLALEDARKDRALQIERLQKAVKIARMSSTERQKQIQHDTFMTDYQKRRLLKQEKRRANEQVYSMLSEDDAELLEEYDLTISDLDAFDTDYDDYDDDDESVSSSVEISHYDSLYDRLSKTFSTDTGTEISSMYSKRSSKNNSSSVSRRSTTRSTKNKTSKAQ